MSVTRRRILVVDDEELVLRALKRVLASTYTVDCAHGGAAALKCVHQDYDLIITDLCMPIVDGFEVLKAVQRTKPKTPVIVITGHGSIRQAVHAMRAGAFDYLTKPLPEPHQLMATVERALGGKAARPVSDAPTAPGSRIGDPTAGPSRTSTDDWKALYADEIVGRSPALLESIRMAVRVADTDAPVLITGESGTGKELFARALHRASRRSAGPFVAVNCPAIPTELVESELFGHAKGAFTGAASARVGRFAACEGGTLFLDEIGELGLPIQAKLLRVLQEYEIVRVGDSLPQRVNVRVVAATNCELEAAVAAGQFRQDLYYRLNVVRLRLPPLRERRADIPLLVSHYLRTISANGDMPPPTLTDEAWEILRCHPWPGNVRQLRNLVERMVLLKRGSVVEAADLDDSPPAVSHTAATPVVSVPPSGPGAASFFPSDNTVKIPPDFDLRDYLHRFEDAVIQQALLTSGGNKNLAAKLLGMNRTTLVEKLRRRGGDPGED